MKPEQVPPEFIDAALSMLELRAYKEAVEILKQPRQNQRARLEQVPQTFRHIVRAEAVRLLEYRKNNAVF